MKWVAEMVTNSLDDKIHKELLCKLIDMQPIDGNCNTNPLLPKLYKLFFDWKKPNQTSAKSNDLKKALGLDEDTPNNKMQGDNKNEDLESQSSQKMSRGSSRGGKMNLQPGS